MESGWTGVAVGVAVGVRLGVGVTVAVEVAVAVALAWRRRVCRAGGREGGRHAHHDRGDEAGGLGERGDVGCRGLRAGGEQHYQQGEK